MHSIHLPFRFPILNVETSATASRGTAGIFYGYTLGVNVEVYLLRGQCWCLSPVKKSMGLGSAMKYKIIMHTFIIPTCRGPWNWIWNLHGPTSVEFPDRKQIKEPYLQVCAFLLSEFTDKTWDLQRFGSLPLPETHVTDWYEVMPKEIANSVWSLEDQTNPKNP